MIAARAQFVARRTAFADQIEAEVQRGSAVPIRYADQRAVIEARLAAMRAAYGKLCVISATPKPDQADFDKAEAICAAWGV
jgi:hypothetical protein